MMNLEDDIKALADVFGEEYEAPTSPKVIPLKPDDKTKPLTLPPSMLESMIQPKLPQTDTAPTKIPQTDDKRDDVTDNRKTFTCSSNSKTDVTPTPTPTPVKRKRGRPRKECNTKTFTGDDKTSKTEFNQSDSQIDERRVKKLSRTLSSTEKRHRDFLPVILDTSTQIKVYGKTSLTYLQIYGQLNRGQLEAVLNQKPSDLPLTIAEIAALDLLNGVVSGDEKAKKMYWDLQKTLEKSKNTPVKPDKNASTLLEKALAEAENAILGEIVVDNPE